MKGKPYNLGKESLRAITLELLNPIVNLTLDLYQIVADERVHGLMPQRAEKDDKNVRPCLQDHGT
jgi:hypothetical protein